MAETSLTTATPKHKSGMVRFSTATLPGLIQAYALAGELLQPYFMARPEKLCAALEDAELKDRAIFMLQQGSEALNCLDCLDAGNMESLRTQLIMLACDLFRAAEKREVR